MTRLRRLWEGDLPLAEAFWHWAVLGGLLANAITTALFLALLVAERPVEALIVHALPVPYNVAAAVGVWRSAARHTGDRRWANTARIVAVAGMILLSVT